MSKLIKTWGCLLLTFYLSPFFLQVQAGELIYRPINPSFGGNPYNASWLMQQAEIQKDKEKQSSYKAAEKDPLKDFAESLNRSILSRLSSKLINSAFGESDLEEGRYEVGEFVIDVTSTSDGINVTITDPATGGETIIEIPNY